MAALPQPESEFSSLLEVFQASLVKDDGYGLLMIDNELAKRRPNTGTTQA